MAPERAEPRNAGTRSPADSLQLAMIHRNIGGEYDDDRAFLGLRRLFGVGAPAIGQDEIARPAKIRQHQHAEMPRLSGQTDHT